MSAYSDAVLADSPLLYLRLDETSGATCANSGSLGGTATCNGTFTRNVTAAHANLGTAVTLQGSGDDDYISYPDTASLDLTGDFTYECWVKLTGTITAGSYLMSKGRDSPSAAGYALFIPSVSPPTCGLAIRVSNTTVLTSATTAIPDMTNWHHIAATRAGNTFTINVDGSSVATTTSSTTAQATAKPLLIGVQQTEFGFQGGFNGSVDEVAVYNTALSSTRIAAHYAAYNAAGASPVADFTGTPLTGTASLSVAFTDTSTNTPTSWAWDFGDGTTSTSQNPSHSYTTSGTYTVSLIASNASGSDTKTRTGYVTAGEAIAYATGGGIEIY